MPGPLHELLSAYLDNEVTVAERAEVEAWLEESTEARRELDELARISGELRGLPMLSVPEGLLQDVFDAIDQSPQDTHAATPARPTDDVVPGRTTDADPPRFATLVGFMATLACVVVVALLIGRRGPDSPDNLGMIASHDARRADRGIDEQRGRDAKPAEFAQVDRLSVDRSRPSDPGDDAEFGAQPDESMRDAEKGEARLYVFEDDDLAKGKAFVDPVEASFENLAAGDIVPFVDRTGDRIAIVEVTVVDVHRAFGEVQLLLQRNEITEFDKRLKETADESPSGTDTKTRARERARARIPGRVLAELEEQIASKKGVRGGESFAVYVSTTPQRLATTLEQLRRSKLVVAVDAESLGKLDDKTLIASHPPIAVAPLAPPNPGDPRPATEGAPGAVAGPREEPTADAPAAGEPAARPTGVKLAARREADSYQVLRRYGDLGAKRQIAQINQRLAIEEKEAELTDPVVRAEAAAKLREVSDGSVRALILLRPAPR